MSHPENFKDYPKSLNEIISDKDHDGAKWTTRDLLIRMLRDLDNGMEIDCMFLAYRDVTDGKSQTGFFSAGKDPNAVLGIIERAKFIYCQG